MILTFLNSLTFPLFDIFPDFYCQESKAQIIKVLILSYKGLKLARQLCNNILRKICLETTVFVDILPIFFLIFLSNFSDFFLTSCQISKIPRLFPDWEYSHFTQFFPVQVWTLLPPAQYMKVVFYYRTILTSQENYGKINLWVMNTDCWSESKRKCSLPILNVVSQI